MNLFQASLLFISTTALALCQASLPRDCHDWLQRNPNSTSGQYVIYPGGHPLPVLCDMESAGGGWTYIHRRFDGSENFYRPWADYRKGFGNLSREFYMGNDRIHLLTYQDGYEMRIDMEAYKESVHAEFTRFSLEDEKNSYRLSVSGFKPSSNTGDSLSVHNGYGFATFDRDHHSCATKYHGAWWYVGCHASNLNGHYRYTDGNKGVVTSYGDNMEYYSFKGHYYALKAASMKIRPHYRAKDCWDLHQYYPRADSGVYTVYPGTTSSQTGIAVYCDMDTDGGGWTTILRRQDGSEIFYRDFKDYEAGFGDKGGEHWLGLKNLHLLSSQRKYELRVDLQSYTERKYAKYSRFVVGDSTALYRLHVTEYDPQSSAGDSMVTHNGQTFSSRDRQTNKQCSGNCAVSSKGGWWYNCCHTSNLLGQYEYTARNKGHVRSFATGVIWSSYRGQDYSLKAAEMKLRPQLACESNGGVRCSGNGHCLNVLSRGTFVCLCDTGFSGDNCQHKTML